MNEPKDFVNEIAQACDDKLAENVVVLDMDSVSLVADYFLICHANSERQVQAIARSVKEVAEKNGKSIQAMEGFDQGRWIVIDTDSVVCHIFHKDERTYYNLERLWGDAPQLELSFRNSTND